MRRETIKSTSDAPLSIAQHCVKLGFCPSGCPTYVLLGEEDDSPRGRIRLMKEMFESNEIPRRSTVEHIDKCLSCLSCMRTCAVSVDYMHLVDHARAYINARYKRPLADRVIRWMIGFTFAHPVVFRAAIVSARLLRPLATRLPARLKTLVELACRQKTSAPGPRRRQVYDAIGKRRGRVAVHAGCVQRVIGPDINASTIRLLRRHGWEVVLVPDVGCCGSLSLHMGDRDRARHQAGAAIQGWYREFERSGLDAIIFNASGCGTSIKDYGHLFGADEPLHDKASKVAKLAFDVTEWLARAGCIQSVIPRGYTVAYHDACSLRNGQRIIEPPRKLLAAAGFRVREVAEKHMCCGSAGTYNILQPEIATRLGKRKAAAAGDSGAQIIAAGNIGCITQIGRYASLPIVHTVELLDWATGGPMPGALVGLHLIADSGATATPDTPRGASARPDTEPDKLSLW
jgi:glycolate oxidase iron-sulfur subunit